MQGIFFVLQCVNGEDEGYFKEEGLFVNFLNILYKFDVEEAGLEGGDEVLICVERGDELLLVIVEIIILNEIDFVVIFLLNIINCWCYN